MPLPLILQNNVTSIHRINITCAKQFDEPTINITSLINSDTLTLNSPKSSDSPGIPSCK